METFIKYNKCKFVVQLRVIKDSLLPWHIEGNVYNNKFLRKGDKSTKIFR
uniref:Uncharacterized protein n=1 Tax=Meloidogyne enterolobii TaxID=390850 RepID=A0A6V7UW68_MELEN|nr:unnamed protein product [Meloidogyne enterolobii]